MNIGAGIKVLWNAQQAGLSLEDTITIAGIAENPPKGATWQDAVISIINDGSVVADLQLLGRLAPVVEKLRADSTSKANLVAFLASTKASS